MTKPFILIQGHRFRTGTIKLYRPFDDGNTDKKFGIHIYYSVIKKTDRETFRFKTKKERDMIIRKIDELLVENL